MHSTIEELLNDTHEMPCGKRRAFTIESFIRGSIISCLGNKKIFKIPSTNEKLYNIFCLLMPLEIFYFLRRAFGLFGP